MPIPTSVRPVNKELIRERVYTMMKNWIIDGTLKSDEKLNDLDLSERLGVSRTPIRESLRRLEDEGFVETAAHKWTKVASVDLEQVKLLYPIVKKLEEMAIELFTSKVGQADLDKMTKLNQEMENAILNKNLGVAIELDFKFHSIFIEGSENFELVKVLDPIKTRLKRAEFNYFSKYSNTRESLKEHEDIIKCLADKNTNGAKRILSTHWDEGLKRFMR